MLFLGFISGKRIQFPGKWAKTLKNPGSLTSTQKQLLPGDEEFLAGCYSNGYWVQGALAPVPKHYV